MYLSKLGLKYICIGAMICSQKIYGLVLIIHNLTFVFFPMTCWRKILKYKCTPLYQLQRMLSKVCLQRLILLLQLATTKYRLHKYVCHNARPWLVSKTLLEPKLIDASSILNKLLGCNGFNY